MSALNYFKARLEATVSPMDVRRWLEEEPHRVHLVDVRIGPADLLKTKIPGAVRIPQPDIVRRSEELPRDRLIVLYCWDTWCSLAVKAAVPLLERGFQVKELYGGMAAWNTLQLPTEPLIDETPGCSPDEGGRCAC